MNVIETKGLSKDYGHGRGIFTLNAAHGCMGRIVLQI